jgi:hypothetical protein
MKKLFITAAIATMFSVTAFAADGGKKTTTATGEANVSYTVVDRFNTDFSDAKNVTWSVTSNCQKVSFTIDAAPMTAFYNLNGEYLGLTEDVDFSTLAKSAKAEIATNYKGYAVNEVIKYNTETSDALVYFVDLKSAASEIVLQVTPAGSVSFFKKVK